MKVEVRLFAGLQKYLPENSSKNSCRMETNQGDTVKDVLEKLNVPSKKLRGLMILANGTHSNLDHVLSEGDVLSVFPVVAGG
jgi:molybdopterin converting factor small subunit